VAVSLAVEAERARAYADRYGIGGTIARTSGDLLAALRLTGVPAAAFVDPSGCVRRVAQGEMAPEAMEAALDAVARIDVSEPCAGPEVGDAGR
jgi:hypothetical protein